MGEFDRSWKHIEPFDKVVNTYPEANETPDLLSEQVDPEDNATIIFASGTTGLPKDVLSTQRQFLTNVLNVLAGGFRVALRNGNPLPSVQRPGPQVGALVAVPLFHMTGSTSYLMMATLTGMKIILTKKWIPEAAGLIREENVGVAGGVPSMVADLTESSLAGHSLEGLLFGGSPTPDSLVGRAKKTFPKATLTQVYGLTEINSVAVSRASFTSKIDMSLAFFRFSDAANHQLYSKRHHHPWWRERVENVLYSDPRVLEAAAVGVPDERLGELVTAVVSIKPAYQGFVTEAALMAVARQRFAVPVMIVVLHEPFELTPSGKIIKGELRKIVRRHWEERRRSGTGREPLANL
ncbi:acetyl-CoA synthetase-like protein [Macrolepiota fuliginosa MF-IS2]|uniref:Acetyl-CoA synthetase-like protein n=1 Tax=Macrolepiota fuliginosa MF-IS2 TaxID=1400762 RepID=A0A9P6C3P3_9AGAR|nr:acetyl-CoA synthetase-like protein [Macrolepiota fuliginosa MF-IS2]